VELKERLHTLVNRLLWASVQAADILADTEGTFRPERIAEIAERFGGNFGSKLSLIRR
jgi:hypothetical protein